MRKLRISKDTESEFLGPLQVIPLWGSAGTGAYLFGGWGGLAGIILGSLFCWCAWQFLEVEERACTHADTPTGSDYCAYCGALMHEVIR